MDIDSSLPFDDPTKIIAEACEAIDRHDLKGARPLLSAALELLLTDEQRSLVLIELGWLDGAEGAFDQAEKHLSEAVAVAERLARPASMCESLRELGVVQRYQGKLPEAHETLSRAVGVGRDCGHHLGIGQALFNLATVVTMAGDFPAARKLLAQATEAADRYRDSDEATFEQVQLLYANIGREKAILARMARDFDSAREILSDTGERYEAINRRVGVANTRRELGAVLQQVGDLDAARHHFGVAFSAYLRSRRPMGAAMVARRMGHLDLLSEPDDPVLLNRAERRLVQSIRLGRGEPTNHAEALVRLSAVARLRGEFADAEGLLDEAEKVYRETERPPVDRDMSEVLKERGMIAKARGRRPEALRLFQEALATIRADEDVQAASVDHFLIAEELLHVGRVDEALPHAIASFTLDDDSGRRLRDPADRRSFYITNRDTYGLAMMCAARAGDGHAALSVAIAAQSEALAAFVRAGARFTPGVRELVEQIILATRAKRPEPELRALFSQLDQHASTQLREAVAPSPVDTREIIASLPPNGHALLLEAFDLDDTMCSRIWLAPGQDPMVDLITLTAPMRLFIDEYTRGSAEIGWSEQHDKLDELGAALVPVGLTRALRSGTGTSPLVVSTGNLLGAVPVAALRVEDVFLAEIAQLAVVPSLNLLASLREREPRQGRGVLAYLDPAVTSQRERSALRDNFTPLVEVDSMGMRDALRDASDFAAVVVMSHGSHPGDQTTSYVDGSARSGLAQALELTGGDNLTAAELMTMSLPDGFITPSCWSARVLSQAAVEPLGLPTAALLAGARWVLAGTVNIRGFPAGTVMSAFYRHLANGLAPSNALHLAQNEFLVRRASVPPGAWAGLTIVGDGFTPWGTTG